ncbi:hypothetical protein [Kitasatospora sp. NPDC093806]|uniref:hypothetical protein n=1 Tax=Kitasatospora sp. NPDC093806 TaxID=3155075 RepID=UPI00342885BF
MTNSLIIVARSNNPLGHLASAAQAPGEEYEFGLGWRMFVTETDIPGTLPEIAKAVYKETGYPAIMAFANSDPGYLGIVFCEKGKTDLTYVTGVDEAKADGFVAPKFKHHPMSAIGAAASWSKKAGLSSGYDALKAAANRSGGPGAPGMDLLLTWLVGLGIPGCADVDPYWNEIGDAAIAQRQAFWQPNVEVRIDL